MSIQSDKLMNLEGGKALYYDLRNRIKQATMIATKAEIRSIINNYNKSDEPEEEIEDGVVVSFILKNGPLFDDTVIPYYESDLTNIKITEAYLSGKNVILNIPYGDFPTATIVGYYMAKEQMANLYESPYEFENMNGTGYIYYNKLIIVPNEEG